LEKQVEFEHRLINLSDKPQEFLEKYALVASGTAQVPLLECEGDVVVESEDVTKYIAENVPGKMLVWEEDAVERFLKIWHSVVDDYYFVLSAGSEGSVKKSLCRFVEDLASLDAILQESEGPYLVGSSFSVAECIAAPWVQRFFVTLPYFRNIDFNVVLEENQFVRTASWMKAVECRPSVVESKCPKDEMLAAAKRYYVSYVTPGSPCRAF